MALSLDWVRSWRLSGGRDLGAQKDSGELDRVRSGLEKVHPVAGLRLKAPHSVAWCG